MAFVPLGRAARNVVVETARKRHNKYGAVSVLVCPDCLSTCDPHARPCPCGTRAGQWIRFDSKAEAAYYVGLRTEEKHGLVRKIVLQPRFPHMVNGKKAFVYRADFSFERSVYGRSWERHVVDVKGMDTPVSRLKRKCVELEYGIRIEVVKRG